MPVPSPNEDFYHWPYHAALNSRSNQFTPLSYSQSQSQSQSQTYAQPQSAQPDWLIGDLDTQAPPASWITYPQSPYIEEFVPPNPPQALGQGIGKALTWPTAAMCRTSPYTGAGVSNIRRSVSDHDQPGPTGSQSFFRRQILKRNRERRERSEVKSEAELSADEISVCRDVNQDLRDLFGSEIRSSSMGTTSGESYRAQSSRHGPLGKRRRGGPVDSLPPGCSIQRVTVHVQSSSHQHASSLNCDCILPDSLTSQIPKLIQPSNPEQHKATLTSLIPTIVYAEFTCADVCRTRGICVHFSFVLGCKKAPDGLICQTCQTKGTEKAVHADRLCARHNNRRFPSFTMSLAEDILATKAQSLRAHEILARSLTGDWDGVPKRIGRRAESDTAFGQKVLGLPIRTINRQADDRDIAISSIETGIEDDDQVMKKVKMDDQNGVANQDDNVYNSEYNIVQAPPTLEHELHMFDDASPHAADFEAFMNKPRQRFDNKVVWY